MKYPEFLKKNGTVGFIAPSFGATIEPYVSLLDKVCDDFKKKGYKICEGPNCRASNGIGKSNTDRACAAEINDFFTSDKADVILSCGGGETMCEDLSYVDFDAIAKAKPHWYMGYSDNTNLTFTLPTLCDIAAIYGPNGPGLGAEPVHPAIADALSLIEGKKLKFEGYDGWERESLKSAENPFAAFNITEPSLTRVYRSDGKEVDFEGRLIGGCIDCLVGLCGTRFDRVKEFAERYKEDGIVWFMESCDLNPISLRRAVWQLDSAGWFKHVKGFIIGRPLHYGEEFMGMDMDTAVIGVLEKYGVPIVLDADLGHLPPQIPFIEGALAKISVSSGRLSVEHILK